ncbi:unnamed protein product [Miscanthus lutarioriparius]|uniref:Uncharacterized protein n=1 Tax=Miscanthus lutarioriparius TaxID=422564 RepID=A0A811NBR2_9POAL|nr:unnamed protein product [Miscanthus lutarioriparius]
MVQINSGEGRGAGGQDAAAISSRSSCCDAGSSFSSGRLRCVPAARGGWRERLPHHLPVPLPHGHARTRGPAAPRPPWRRGRRMLLRASAPARPTGDEPAAAAGAGPPALDEEEAGAMEASSRDALRPARRRHSRPGSVARRRTTSLAAAAAALASATKAKGDPGTRRWEHGGGQAALGGGDEQGSGLEQDAGEGDGAPRPPRGVGRRGGDGAPRRAGPTTFEQEGEESAVEKSGRLAKGTQQVKLSKEAEGKKKCSRHTYEHTTTSTYYLYLIVQSIRCADRTGCPWGLDSVPMASRQCEHDDERNRSAPGGDGPGVSSDFDESLQRTRRQQSRDSVERCRLAEELPDRRSSVFDSIEVQLEYDVVLPDSVDVLPDSDQLDEVVLKE